MTLATLATAEGSAVGGEAPMELGARIVVNAAGLWAPALASATQGLAAQHVPQGHHAKGNYFSLRLRAVFAPDFPPVPEQAGLGAPHARSCRPGAPGPDVNGCRPARRCDTIHYRRPRAARASVRRDPPLLAGGATARCSRPTAACARSAGALRSAVADFRRAGPRGARHCRAGQPVRHRVAGLTACLAIADEVLGPQSPS